VNQFAMHLDRNELKVNVIGTSKRYSEHNSGTVI